MDIDNLLKEVEKFDKIQIIMDKSKNVLEIYLEDTSMIDPEWNPGDGEGIGLIRAVSGGHIVGAKLPLTYGAVEFHVKDKN